MKHVKEHMVSLYRPKLTFSAYSFVSEDARQKKLKHLLKRHMKSGDGSCIIYCNTKKHADTVYDLIKTWYPDQVAICRSNLPNKERKRNEKAFMRGERRIMVATSAFGMGINKSDVRLIIHYIPVSFQSGVHTFEVGQPLTKEQFTVALNLAHARGKLIHNKKGQESYVLLDQQMPGITVTLYPIHQRRTYRVNIKVEPCRVLGSDDPTALYQYSKKTFHKLQQLCDRYLEMLCIPGSIETMKVSRCDLTCNLGFPDQQYVDAYLRILKKSHMIPGYKADIFKTNEKKAKDPNQANQHSHCIRCKQASLLCYDKIDQLKMVGRCPRELEDAAILRLEVQLKRPALSGAVIFCSSVVTEGFRRILSESLCISSPNTVGNTLPKGHPVNKPLAWNHRARGLFGPLW